MYISSRCARATIKNSIFVFLSQIEIEIFRTEPNRANFCSNWFHAIIHSSKKNDFRGHPTVNFYYPEHTFNFHLILQSRLPIAPRWSQLFKSIARAQIVYLFSFRHQFTFAILFCFNVWFNVCSSTQIVRRLS